MDSMKKKLLASLMALGLLVGMLTTAAMAVEGGDDGSVEATAVVTDEETPESIPVGLNELARTHQLMHQQLLVH